MRNTFSNVCQADGLFAEILNKRVTKQRKWLFYFGREGVFIGVIFHLVRKMNIYESRKVMLDSKMHSAGRLSDSRPMLEETGRQIHQSRLRGCDRVA